MSYFFCITFWSSVERCIVRKSAIILSKHDFSVCNFSRLSLSGRTNLQLITSTSNPVFPTRIPRYRPDNHYRLSMWKRSGLVFEAPRKSLGEITRYLNATHGTGFSRQCLGNHGIIRISTGFVGLSLTSPRESRYLPSGASALGQISTFPRGY